MNFMTNYNFTSNYPISESAIRSLFMDIDDAASNYPMIRPKRILHDPEYFKRSVDRMNDTFTRFGMNDVMNDSEYFKGFVMRLTEVDCNSPYPKPVKIIYNPPATIVFWTDGTKTVVKCCEEDEYNEYYGFLCALGKKMFGTNSHLKKMIDEKAERHYIEDEFSKRIEQLRNL